jgi:hypothetical protein
MSHPDFDDLARRPAKYWHIDGLPELMVGLLWIVWGAAWLIGQTLPHDWRWTTYWLLMPPALAAAGFGMNWATRRLKERFTFPRAGYVAWNPPTLAARALAAAFAIGGALLLAAFVLWGDVPMQQRMPAVLGGVLSLAFLAIAVHQHTPHHFVLAGAALILTIAIVPSLSGWNAFNWLLLALGAACAAVGTLRLLTFLKTHPPLAEGL